MIPVNQLLDTVVIYEDIVTGRTETGKPIIDWVARAELKADIQPAGGETVVKRYGITDTEITNLMFINNHKALDHGRRVECKGIVYSISYIADYRSHLEVLLKVVGRYDEVQNQD